MNPLNNLLTYVLDFLCIKTKIFFLDFPSMINLWRLKEMNIWFHFIYAHISDDYFDSIFYQNTYFWLKIWLRGQIHYPSSFGGKPLACCILSSIYHYQLHYRLLLIVKEFVLLASQWTCVVQGHVSNANCGEWSSIIQLNRDPIFSRGDG